MMRIGGCIRRFERGPAAATAHGIRILDTKPGAGQVVAVVDDGTIEKTQAFAIDNHLHTIAGDNLVTSPGVREAHGVLQAGATAVLHVDAQPLGGVILLAKHNLQLANGRFCDLNHWDTR